MFFVSIFAAAYVLGVVHSTPTSTYHRRDIQLADRPEMLYFNQIQGFQDVDPSDSSLEGQSIGGARIKRLGSLSIVNPLDVLRERVLLELARRKMRQNQRQVDANRRLLQTIGKRAIPNNNSPKFAMDLNEDPDPNIYGSSSKANNYLYTYRIPENDVDLGGPGGAGGRPLHQHQRFISDIRATGEGHQDWENHGDEDPVVEETENDQTRRMANELNLL